MIMEAEKIRRVVFSFGPDSLDKLNDLIERGFKMTHVRLKDPVTGEERELIIPEVRQRT